MPSDDAPDAAPPRLMTLPLAQREVALLLVLSIVSIGLFLATRRLAEWERDRNQREAAIWYEQGQALLQAGDSAAATEALRRAVTAERDNSVYVLGLARALSDSRRDAEALRLLTGLREEMPDSAEVNYRLARLLARSDATESAIRYYYLALYSPVAGDAGDERFTIGLELAALLLQSGDPSGAAGTLTSVAREVPDAVGPHLQVAALFEQAGDYPRALEHFAAAGDFDPKSIVAASGAGRVALTLHAYDDAERSFRRAVALGSSEDRASLETATTARRVDPFARGLPSRTRAARLVDGLVWATSALAACVAPDEASPSDAALRPALTAFSKAHTAVDLRDADLLAEGVGLVVGAAGEVARTCGADDATVRAWLIVGLRREGAAS